MGAQFSVGETGGQPTEQHQRAQEGLDARISKPQGRGPLRPNDNHQSVDLPKGGFAHGTIVAEPSDAHETPIGGKAERPRRGQARQPCGQAEVVGVVDGGLCAQGAAFLVILLDPGLMVVHMQRRGHPLSDHPGPDAARRAGTIPSAGTNCGFDQRPASPLV